jgi:hypothetical protein
MEMKENGCPYRTNKDLHSYYLNPVENVDLCTLIGWKPCIMQRIYHECRKYSEYATEQGYVTCAIFTMAVCNIKIANENNSYEAFR